jgi:alpha-tubulin suppressor-like RCC1 family protein
MSALTPIAPPSGRSALAIGAGAGHVCAFLDDMSARCWGANTHGQLGLGNTTVIGDQASEVSALPPIDVGGGTAVRGGSVGATHNCVLVGASAKCFGNNASGQLGYGDMSPRGAWANQMGVNLPPLSL